MRLHRGRCNMTGPHLDALLVNVRKSPSVRRFGTSTGSKMKRHLVVTALFAVMSADRAWAAQPFDGTRAVSVTSRHFAAVAIDEAKKVFGCVREDLQLSGV
jgi:hypothetical protein